MIKSRATTYYQLFDPSSDQSFIIDKSKYIIGSSHNCDIKLSSATISHYHLFLSVLNDGVLVKDLDSKNGTYINGKLLENTHLLFAGDQLQLGDVTFILNEICDPSFNNKIFDMDQKVVAIDNAPHLLEIPASDENWVYIDGEYCNILFDDETEASKSKNTLHDIIDLKREEQSYIDLDTIHTAESDYLTWSPGIDTSKPSQLTIQITLLNNSHIIDLYHLPVTTKSKTIYAIGSEAKKSFSRNYILIDALPKSYHAPLIKIENNKIYTQTIEGFKSSANLEEQLNLNQEHSYYNGPVQIKISLIKSDRINLASPLITVNKDELKYGSAALLFLFLLFMISSIVDIPSLAVPKKTASIIYKKASNKSNARDLESGASSSETDSDPKKEQQVAKDSPSNKAIPVPTPTQNISNASKKLNEKRLPIAQNKPHKPQNQITTKRPNPSKLETKVKINKALTSFLNNKVQKIENNTASLKDRGVNIASSSIAIQALNSGIASGSSKTSLSKNWGKGQLDQGSGPGRGLGSKQGIDTNIVETETVILGSIDPELLKEILRQHLPQFRYCYQQEIERQGNLKGMLDLSFRIEGNGKVSLVDIKGNKKFSNDGTNCMAHVLKKIQFPRPKGGGIVDVKQPLNFYAQKARI